MTSKQTLMSPEEWAHRLATDPVVRALAEHLAACAYFMDDEGEYEAHAMWSSNALLDGSGLTERAPDIAEAIYQARPREENDDEDDDEGYDAAGRESRIREGVAAAEITLAPLDGLFERDVQ